MDLDASRDSLSRSKWASEKMQAFRNVTDIDELERKYDDLGEEYETVVKSMQYSGPKGTAKGIAKLEPNRNAKILDIGCGTGLVGQELFNDGYREIHGIDLSAGLLKVLEKKQIYSKQIKARFDRSTPLNYADGYFDVVTSCASFMPGAHLSQTCLPEIFRLLKRGGYMVITTRKDIFEGEVGGMKLKTALMDHVKEGTLKKISHEETTFTTENNEVYPGIVLSYQLIV